MKKKYCRYSEAQLRSLGYEPTFDENVPYIEPSPADDMVSIARGQFGNIIDVLYTSTDGSLDNDLHNLVSENAPESVRSFVNNVLLCNLQAFQSAPDDETAFRCLIPREAYAPNAIKPYLEDIKQFISERRPKSQNLSNI